MKRLHYLLALTLGAGLLTWGVAQDSSGRQEVRVTKDALPAAMVPGSTTAAAALPSSTVLLKLTNWASPEAMHAEVYQRFINSPGNGISRMRTPLMLAPQYRTVQVDGRAYRVNSLELVGIARHDPPVVYANVGDHDELRLKVNEIPKRDARALTLFEESALAKLRAGTEVITRPTANNQVQVVGAVRAQKACLECHATAKVGDVLGAFSYRLRR